MNRLRYLLTLGCGLGLLTFLLPPPPTATAHNGEDHGAPTTGRAVGGASDEVLLPKESQFLFEIRTQVVAAPAAVLTRRTLLGTVAAAPGGEGRVVAPQAGRLVALRARIGERVQAGQVLAVLDQTLGAPEQVGLAANRAAAQAELRAAEQDYQRLQRIADIAARKDVVAAELRLRAARQSAGIQAQSGTARRIELKAPISGVVEGFALATGQQVAAGEELIRVLDPRRLVVEAQVFPDDLPALDADARFRVEGLTGAGTTSGVPARLLTVSNALDPTNQARRLVLALTDSGGPAALRVGQRVSVRVQARAATAALVVPTAAITDVNGLPAVFVHTAPEVFRLRYVQVGPEDARQTVVRGGLQAGERVVTTNTYQLKSVYLNQ